METDYRISALHRAGAHTHTHTLMKTYTHSLSSFPSYPKAFLSSFSLQNIRKIPMVYVNKELLSYALWNSINLKVKSKVFQGQLPLFVD